MKNNIRKYRKIKHMSQLQLAELLHVHQTAVSQWENGKTEPDITNLSRMAEIFDASVDEVMGLSGHEKPAAGSGELDEDLFRLIRGLDQKEQLRLKGFAEGLIASRAEEPFRPK